MSDNLISLQNKRISILEKQLEKEQDKLKQLNKLYDKDGLPPIIMEIEKVVNKWNLTLPSGIVIEGLDSLKYCSFLIKEKYNKAQFQNRPFHLKDLNTSTIFRDYRVFTEYFGMVDGEIVELSDKAEKQMDETIALAKKVRNTKTKRVQSKVKKIDARIFDRTY
tara:strand:+ start:926 stop:1417 length:492 start_codon:yes stop_codon:yes gene_type:complete